MLYLEGVDAAPDPAKALEWLTAAALSQDAEAQLQLGILYSEGSLGQADPVEGYAWLSLAKGSTQNPTLRQEADSRMADLEKRLSPDQRQQAEARVKLRQPGAAVEN